MSEVLIGRAVVARDRELAIEEIEVQPPGPGEVRVELRASGVCHTDHDLAQAGFPCILGHEGAGIVESVGDGVDDLAPGDPVLLTWAIACRDCPSCNRGNLHLCERWSPNIAGPTGGGHVDFSRLTVGGSGIYRAFHLGTMATHSVVLRAAIVPLPATIPFAYASILGCGVQTGIGSVLNAARVQPGESVAVLGCGGVGLNVIQGARMAGASPIVGVDVIEGRLELARRFGATHTVLADRDDPDLRQAAHQVFELIGTRPDYAFECTAVPTLGASPLAMIRHGGTAIAVSGIEQTVPIDMSLFEWDKTYLTPLYGQCDPMRDFPRLFDAYLDGSLLLDELVTQTYALDDFERAFEDLLARRNAKGVIEITR